MAQEQSSLAKLRGSSSVAADAWKYIGGAVTQMQIYICSANIGAKICINHFFPINRSQICRAPPYNVNVCLANSELIVIH